ncbi:tif32, partial [Ophiophagus hannah]
MRELEEENERERKEKGERKEERKRKKRGRVGRKRKTEMRGKGEREEGPISHRSNTRSNKTLGGNGVELAKPTQPCPPRQSLGPSLGFKAHPWAFLMLIQGVSDDVHLLPASTSNRPVRSHRQSLLVVLSARQSLRQRACRTTITQMPSLPPRKVVKENGFHHMLNAIIKPRWHPKMPSLALDKVRRVTQCRKPLQPQQSEKKKKCESSSCPHLFSAPEQCTSPKGLWFEVPTCSASFHSTLPMPGLRCHGCACESGGRVTHSFAGGVFTPPEWKEEERERPVRSSVAFLSGVLNLWRMAGWLPACMVDCGTGTREGREGKQPSCRYLSLGHMEQDGAPLAVSSPLAGHLLMQFGGVR